MVIGTGGPRERRLAAQKIKEKYKPEAKKFKEAVDGIDAVDGIEPEPEYEIEEDKEPLSKEEKESIKEVLDEED